MSALPALRMEKMSCTIAVDLTPLLPGGDNGGAKIVILELLPRLAAQAPDLNFLLLTQAASHAELAVLERDNVTRRQVLDQTLAGPARAGLQAVARRVLPHLPARARGWASHLGYRVHRLMKRGARARRLRDLGVEVLFCPFTAPTFAEPGVATLCLVHDVQFMTYPDYFAPDDLANREWSLREACRRADRLVANSEHTRDTVLATGWVEAARITTIPLRLAGRCAASSSLAAPPSPAGRVLLYPANPWPHKNHELLLTAFGMACRQGLPEDVRLVCTGAPGARQRELRAAAAALGLGERVSFPGFLSEGEFAAVLAGAHAVVFPSLYEGFGLPVLEAMAAGVPVACSRVTALPEVAGAAALYFDPRCPEDVAAALLRVTLDTDWRAAASVAGRERARRYSDPERMAADYLRLLRESRDARARLR